MVRTGLNFCASQETRPFLVDPALHVSLFFSMQVAEVLVADFRLLLVSSAPSLLRRE